MRAVIAVVVVVGLLVGVPLARDAGWGGLPMVLFALLAVVFFSSLPVVFARIATRTSGGSGDHGARRVARLDASPPESCGSVGVGSARETAILHEPAGSAADTQRSRHAQHDQSPDERV